MAELRPLEQWYCDTCDEVIARADDGILAFRLEADGSGERAFEFRIVHLACEQGASEPSSLTKRPLKEWVGSRGLALALALVDPGPHHAPKWERAGVRDLREWVELVRRLHLPHYEEARISWEDAEPGFFGDVTPQRIYAPDYLLRMILHFEALDAQAEP